MLKLKATKSNTDYSFLFFTVWDFFYRSIQAVFFNLCTHANIHIHASEYLLPISRIRMINQRKKLVFLAKTIRRNII